MVIEVLAEVRQRQRASYDQVPTATFAEACQTIWKQMSAPDSEPLFRLFFEAYGIALRHPQPYKAFLRATVEDWLRLIADPLCRKGYARGKARAFATVVLAGLRGFMLDFCNTRDRKRLDHALSLWLRTLDPMLSDPEEA